MLASYKNGDYNVTIFSNGTKVREWSVENPTIEFPESVDMKITDYCDLGCPYCHEKSTPSGKDAKIENILSLVNGLPPGVELALGGGNPLFVWNLPLILSELSKRGLICNMTVNEKHLTPETCKSIRGLREMGLIHGLGVSMSQFGYGYEAIRDENTVLHVVAGVNSVDDVRHLIATEACVGHELKVLVLGYKQFGRGAAYYSPEVQHGIDKWRYFIGSFINSNKVVVSFDNLALEQLRIKDIVPQEVWDAKFMGNDGEFTMYVDAVKMEFARSSVGERMAVDGRTIKELFHLV